MSENMNKASHIFPGFIMSKKSRKQKSTSQRKVSPAAKTQPDKTNQNQEQINQPKTQTNPTEAVQGVEHTTPKKRGPSLFKYMLLLIIVFGCCWAILEYFHMKHMRRERAEKRMVCRNQLKRICLAVHAFHDARKYLPLVAFSRNTTNPGLSWRVVLLPYLDHADLYKEFHLDEPWDSEHNKPLLKKMPAVYKHPFSSTIDATNGLTHFQVFVSSDENFYTPFSNTKRKRTLLSIGDGPSNTILVAEAKHPVPWTKPEDLPISSSGSLPEIGGLSGENCLVGLCDGSVRSISPTISAETLRNAININDGNTLGSDW